MAYDLEGLGAGAGCRALIHSTKILQIPKQEQTIPLLYFIPH
ncbi:hypothetical protein [Metabacillus litoralis]|nr:hypothetical protein [Metabacillus litoralis]